MRLTDVDPEGAHLLLGEGIQRLKLHADLCAPALVPPGTRTALTVTLTSEFGYTFAAGHRVGLIVSASNHPASRATRPPRPRPPGRRTRRRPA